MSGYGLAVLEGIEILGLQQAVFCASRGYSGRCSWSMEWKLIIHVLVFIQNLFNLVGSLHGSIQNLDSHQPDVSL